ncbi:hypothetical protein SAMN05192544_100590 [Paraburkholderia hospita]|jgi:hypothetical protein|nr:hypothetical protein SAMN05192544_100590 [Paraburkholderia hospita]
MHLTGKINALKSYNALHVTVPTFMKTMDELREKYLNA